MKYQYLVLLGLLLLTACSTLPAQPGPVAVNDYCQIAQPVQVSRADTRATKEQADREYRKYKAVCGPR